MPAMRRSAPVGPGTCAREDALGLLAGDEPRAAHAVAADVHQRAAVDGRRGGGSSGLPARKPNEAWMRLHGPDLASATRCSSCVCGLWRHMKASASTRPAASARSNASSASCGAAGVRLLAQHVLAGCQRPHRPLVVHGRWAARCRPRRRRVGQQRLVGAVRRRDALLGSVGRARRRRRGWRRRRSRHRRGLARGLDRRDGRSWPSRAGPSGRGRHQRGPARGARWRRRTPRAAARGPAR